MAEYRLVGGESYSLKELFFNTDSRGNEKVVIPDLQRDYCWANENNNLVGPFVDSLLNLDKGQDMTLGLVYGYFDPLMPDHLQLCDGQQRITTLFLLVGVLNRRLKGVYNHLLISDFELKKDDSEPYLQYSIRESSLYFISDLVVHYFLHNDSVRPLACIDEIKNSYWFLSAYHIDPTINCILSAISTIEQKLESVAEVELRTLGDFITGDQPNMPHISFLYYDMGNRTNGEETFVVINTTGEPLSANQNLKPLVINEYKGSINDIESKWEEMETWFWRNRDKKDLQHTSDEGMMEFFRCARLFFSNSAEQYFDAVESKGQFPYKDIDFNNVLSLFKAYSRVYAIDYSSKQDGRINYNNKNNGGRYSAEQLYSLLPTLRYCLMFENACDDEDIKRIYHMFKTMARYQTVDNRRDKDDGKIEIPVKRMMSIVDSMTDKDVLCLKDSDLLHEQEHAKLQFIYANIQNREAVEARLVEAENNSIFNGRIKVLIDWCNNSFSEFEKYYVKICNLWEGDCGNNIDTLRRALLTERWNEYPISVNNKSHVTLGWEWNDWYRFFTSNDTLVKNFLDSSLSLDDRIINYSNTSDPYYTIIKEPAYISQSLYKNVNPDDNDIIVLMEKERPQANYCIFFKTIPYPKDFLGGNWPTPWRWNGLLYCNHSLYDLTIDYIYEPGKGYYILLWQGKNHAHIPFKHLKEVEQQHGFERVDKGTEGWRSEYILDANEAKSKMIKVANWVDSF